MFALLSLPPPPYEYGYIVGPVMIGALAFSIFLFMAFPRAKNYILLFVAILGFFDTLAFPKFPEGIGIGFLTLTCFGIMATFHFAKMFVIRILAGLAFGAFGLFLIPQAIDALSKMSLQIMSNLTSWSVLLSWGLTTFSGGLLILILAFKKRFKKSDIVEFSKDE